MQVGGTFVIDKWLIIIILLLLIIIFISICVTYFIIIVITINIATLLSGVITLSENIKFLCFRG